MDNIEPTRKTVPPFPSRGWWWNLWYNFVWRFFPTKLALRIIFGLGGKYYHEDGTPKKCWKCGSKKFIRKNEDWINETTLCEYDLHCKECDSVLGHWLMGYYQIF